MTNLIVKDWDDKQRLVLYDELSSEISDSNDSEYLSAEQIKKMLKHEKNPMRINQLNKMLYGRRKKWNLKLESAINIHLVRKWEL